MEAWRETRVLSESFEPRLIYNGSKIRGQKNLASVDLSYLYFELGVAGFPNTKDLHRRGFQ